jgi:GH15 family glucan-1,4-alpha-glucosidase
MLDYGIIGNCAVSALVSNKGTIVWFCLPGPDGEPICGELLDEEGGGFGISLEGAASERPGVQRYIENTNVLQTDLMDACGNAIRITDFFPRFERAGGVFRPRVLYRRVEPLAGSPHIRVRCNLVSGWSKSPAPLTQSERGGVDFATRGGAVRLRASTPLLAEHEVWRGLLQGPIHFALSLGDEGGEGLEQADSWLDQTVGAWRHWVKHCSIPSLFQNETIRSALVLKLHCHEDSGAILAAMTTSLPEERGSNRNWDYRYCWLRDAAFVLSAFHHLGHYEEMEGFLRFLSELALTDAFRGEKGLAPVYSVHREAPLPEELLSQWRGFEGSVPVRIRNQAAEHVQNDVYGEMLLALAPIFLDERFKHLRNPELENLMQRLIELGARSIGRKDAGLWEFRDGWREHAFSNLMSWAGIERSERIASQGWLRGLNLDLRAERLRAEQAVMRAIKDGSLRNGPEDESFDASLLLAPVLRFPSQPLNRKTVDDIRAGLELGPGSPFLYRYRRKDDFGTPRSAFLLCSFWLVQALAATGRKEEGRLLLEKIRESSNALGLLSEHYNPHTRTQLGNFPQAYSHVGMIQAAFAVSPPWSDIL